MSINKRLNDDKTYELTDQIFLGCEECYSFEDYGNLLTVQTYLQTMKGVSPFLQSKIIMNKNNQITKTTIRINILLDNKQKEILIEKGLVSKVYAICKIYSDNTKFFNILLNRSEKYNTVDILNKINENNIFKGAFKTLLKIDEFPIKNYYLEEKENKGNNNNIEKEFILKKNAQHNNKNQIYMANNSINNLNSNTTQIFNNFNSNLSNNNNQLGRNTYFGSQTYQNINNINNQSQNNNINQTNNMNLNNNNNTSNNYNMNQNHNNNQTNNMNQNNNNNASNNYNMNQNNINNQIFSNQNFNNNNNNSINNNFNQNNNTNYMNYLNIIQNIIVNNRDIFLRILNYIQQENIALDNNLIQMISDLFIKNNNIPNNVNNLNYIKDVKENIHSLISKLNQIKNNNINQTNQVNNNNSNQMNNYLQQIIEYLNLINNNLNIIYPNNNNNFENNNILGNKDNNDKIIKKDNEEKEKDNNKKIKDNIDINDNNLFKEYENYFPLIGLRNVGLTCYMNSILQCLLHIPELNAYFINKYPEQKNKLKNINKDVDTRGRLCEEYHQIVLEIYKANNKSYIVPKDFNKFLSNINDQFAQYEANDAKDLLLYLLQAMHSELNYNGEEKLKSVPRCNQTIEKESFNFFLTVNCQLNLSIISYLFYGINKSITVCLSCKKTLYNFQYFQFLSFPTFNFKDKDFNLYQGFKEFIKPELMSGDNKCYCQSCKGLRDAKVTTKIYAAPPYLIINIDYGKNKKYMPKKVSFGGIIEIGDFVDKYENNVPPQVQYRLIAVSTHLGRSGSSGHYITYCQDNQDEWYEFNDSSVSSAKFKEINSYSPYVLVFKKN